MRLTTAASVECSSAPHSHSVELGRCVHERQQQCVRLCCSGVSRAEPRLISASMACMMGSRKEVASSAAGGLPPGGTTGASISSRCSISWWSWEKPCDGSRTPTSTVERLDRPQAASESLGEMSTRRPRHSSVSPDGPAAPAAPHRCNAGSTNPSQKARVEEWRLTRRQRGACFLTPATKKPARRNIVVGRCSPADEGPGAAAIFRCPGATEV